MGLIDKTEENLWRKANSIVNSLDRLHVYRRLDVAMHGLIARKYVLEDRRSEMVIKVDIQEALNRLHVCPVCGNQLVSYYEAELTRSCSCGDFVITAVWGDGDVEFTYKMNATSYADHIAKIEETSGD